MSTAQGVMGTVALLALAALPLWWAKHEGDRGNRAFLLALTALLLTLAVWRGVSTARAALSPHKSAQD